MSHLPTIVTGGAGFLGSHLIDRLIGNGEEVLCIDNLYTGSLENIKHLKNNTSLKFINHDISKSFDFKSQKIFNLACPASPIHYQYDPIQTLKTSVWGAMNIAESGVESNAKVLHASTSEIYGDPLVHPQVESYWGNVNPVGIRSCYDEGKRCAETILYDFKRMHSLDVRMVRIFNTYGPRMDQKDGRVVSNFIVQALKNESLTLYGDGKQTRSFCYVDDLIDGFLKFMNTPNDPKLNNPINLGNPNEFTVLELANLVKELTGSASNIEFMPLPSDDPIKRKPNISLAQSYLDWKPSIELKEGLLKTIEYFDNLFLKQ